MSQFDRLIEESSLGAEGARLLRNRAEQPDADATGRASVTRLPPELADRFSLVRELPAGGEADILVVTDSAGTELVLKLYRAGIVPSPETWGALQTVSSPHVARLVDWGDADGRVFEVMEYVGDDTLCDLAEDSSHYDLDADSIAEIVRQVAEGLKALHGARVIHRDLKPANILVRSWSPLQLALADFGLSRYVENTTVFSAAGHTLAYTAPETFAGHVSPSRDWWSLGMVVRELAMREPPFDGLSTEVVMLALASRSIDCSQIADPRLRLLCRGLLIRDPVTRWGAAEVVRWLAGESPEVRENPVTYQLELRSASTTWRGLCPYRGLAPYEENDAEVFCGRDQMTAALVESLAAQLDRASAVVVTGPSGAGKSSLLRAGLLPRIAGGALAPGSQDWPRVLMTPGRAPLDELAVRLAPFSSRSVGQLRQFLNDRPSETGHLLWQALQAGTPSRHDPHHPTVPKRLVLIIDQFEEVFTLAERAERATFIEILGGMTESADDAEGPAAVVILGLRADFFAQCTGYKPLMRVLQSSTFVVCPMTRNDIRMAIIQPAAVVGLTFEAGLVDVIVADAGSVSPLGDLEPGMLPFLSQAMLETWQHRTGTMLTLSAYKARGGVTRSIQTSAEKAYSSLSPGEQHAARTLLCRMVAIGTDGQITRRSIELSEFRKSAANSDMAAAMSIFTCARLIVVQEDVGEIVHDTLLHAWPRFRQWIEEDAAQIQIREQIAQSAKAWVEGGRDPAYLYPGTRLSVALNGLDSQRDLPDTARDFLRASRRLQRRLSRRRRSVIAILVILIVSSVTVAAVAVHLARTAAAQRATAVSRQIAFESQNVSNPAISALLAVAAWRISPTAEAGGDMATADARENMTTLSGLTGSVFSLAFSPDGRILATVSTRGTVRLWNPSTDHQIGKPLIAGDVSQVAFSPDGRILATASLDGVVGLWNLATSEQIGTLPTSVDKIPGGIGPLPISVGATQVAFSPDGKFLATAGQYVPIRVWNVATRQQIGSPLRHSFDADNVTFSPDGQTLAAESDAGVVQLWKPVTGKKSGVGTLLTGVGGQVTFSLNSRILATAGTDGVVPLWNPETGRQIGALLTGTGSTQATFSPDGRTLATASTDGTVRLWNIATLQQIGGPLTGDGIVEAAFSSDGRILATASTTHTVQLWMLPDTISPVQLSKAICAKAGHGLSRAQWARYIPGTPYQQSCPS